ncbi:MAG: hypothetical protein RSB16_05535 [Raoultibacter sp.]
MDTEKKAVSNMIQQIRDRLDDVEESLETFEGDLKGYVARFDRIDDRLFEIEEEFEVVIEEEIEETSEGVEEASGAPRAKGAKAVVKKDQSVDDDDESIPLVTKEAVASATGDANVIYKEGKATVVELAEAFNDIKSALDFKSLLK